MTIGADVKNSRSAKCGSSTLTSIKINLGQWIQGPSRIIGLYSQQMSMFCGLGLVLPCSAVANRMLPRLFLPDLLLHIFFTVALVICKQQLTDFFVISLSFRYSNRYLCHTEQHKFTLFADLSARITSSTATIHW